MFLILFAVGVGMLGFSMCASFFLAIFTPVISSDQKSAIAWRVVGRKVSREFASSSSAMQYRSEDGELGEAWLDSLVRAKAQFVWCIAVIMPAPLILVLGLFLEAMLHPKTRQGYELFYAAGVTMVIAGIAHVLLRTLVERCHARDSMVQQVTWALHAHDRIMEKKLKRLPTREVHAWRLTLSTVEASLVGYWSSNSLRGAEFGNAKVAWLLERLRKSQNDLLDDFAGTHHETVQTLYRCIDLGCGLRWKSLPDGDPQVLRSRLAASPSWTRRLVALVPPMVLTAMAAVLSQIHFDGQTVAVSTLLGAAVTAGAAKAGALCVRTLRRSTGQTPLPGEVAAPLASARSTPTD